MANLLLDLADEQGLFLTHMAIHKIAYFAHGWRLAQRGEPLIRQQFEAWDYGPVLRSVYDAFKFTARAQVTTRAMGIDPVTRIASPVRADFPTEDRQFLRAILLAYGRYSATHLSDLTHRRGGAWDRVWNAPDGRITLGMRIPDETIRDDVLAGRMNPADSHGRADSAASQH